MVTLVLMRHGESTWNLENRFTGWTDVPLTKKGEQEAKQGGKLLKEGKYSFDIIYTSVLKRAIDTLQIVLKEMSLVAPIVKAWQLNERHYGALQGLNKSEMAQKYGEEKVHQWRRSYDIPPPPLDVKDSRHPMHDPLYKDLKKTDLPSAESLKLTVKRVIPYWKKVIAPQLKVGKKVFICAHGNSLRALVMYLDNISEKDIPELNIPTGVPLIYELDDKLKAIKHYYLGNQDEIAKKSAAVASQGKAK